MTSHYLADDGLLVAAGFCGGYRVPLGSGSVGAGGTGGTVGK
ncbi:hypothetical protein [Polynucleobacter alcilacus]|nr:hypothetical protein [Polynucleobacter alcilacus]